MTLSEKLTVGGALKSQEQKRRKQLLQSWNNMSASQQKVAVDGLTNDIDKYGKAGQAVMAEVFDWNAKFVNGRKAQNYHTATKHTRSVFNPITNKMEVVQIADAKGNITWSKGGDDPFAWARIGGIKFSSPYENQVPTFDPSNSSSFDKSAIPGTPGQKTAQQPGTTPQTPAPAAPQPAQTEADKAREERRKERMERIRQFNDTRRKAIAGVEDREDANAISQHSGGWLSSDAAKDVRMEADARKRARQLGVAYTGGTVADVEKMAEERQRNLEKLNGGGAGNG